MAFMGYMGFVPPSEPVPPTPAQLDEFVLPQAQVDEMVSRIDAGAQEGPIVLDADAGKRFFAARTVSRDGGPALVGYLTLPCAIEGMEAFDVETPAIIEQERPGWWMQMWRKVRQQPPIVHLRAWSIPDDTDPLLH